MLASKVFRYLVVILPAVLFVFSPIAEPLNRALFKRYDVRWFKSRDVKARTQTVGVYNGSDRPLPLVLVDIDIQAEVRRPVADMSFTHVESSLGTSFFDTVVRAIAATGLPSDAKGTIEPVLDTHYKDRTLPALDQAFDTTLSLQLQKDKTLAKAASELQRTGKSCPEWHSAWIDRCSGSLLRPECKLVNDVLGHWETWKRKVHEDACELWHQTGSIKWLNPDGQLAPRGKMLFSFPLESDEAGFLTFRAGPSQVNSAEPSVVTSTIDHVTRVDNADDLRASFIYISFKYNFFFTVFFLLVLCFSSVWAFKALTLPLQPAHRTVNLALETDYYVYWELVFQQYHLDIISEYGRLRAEYDRNHRVSLDPEEVLSHVKAMLEIDYNENHTVYESEQQLDTFISNSLETLLKKLTATG